MGNTGAGSGSLLLHFASTQRIGQTTFVPNPWVIADEQHVARLRVDFCKVLFPVPDLEHSSALP